jgi:hypothetical protein
VSLADAYGGLLKALSDESTGALGADEQAAFAARLAAEAAKEPDGAATTLKRFGDFGKILAAATSQMGADPQALAASIVDANEDGAAARRRLIGARYSWLRALVTQGAKSVTKAGPGRSDPNSLLRNLFTPDNQIDQVTPNSIPDQFYMRSKRWMHVLSNTNSLWERDLEEAIGAGAPTDYLGPDATFATTANLPSKHAIEQAAYKARPPTWPADAPPLDSGRVARGLRLYVQLCQGCHQPESVEGMFEEHVFPVDQLGTDPNLLHVEAGVTIPSAADGVLPIQDVLHLTAQRVFAKYYADNQTAPATQAAWADLAPAGLRDAPMARTSLAYKARPLDGAWATAPYLHNGSVPTLWDLLSDESLRPAQFYLGQRQYDLERVGYLAQSTPDPSSGATFLFDTATSGNSNHGHSGAAYGTTLSDEDKWSLIEFLKGFGGGASSPVRLK